MRLRIRSLEAQSEKHKVFYTFGEDEDESATLIICDIFAEHARTMIDDETSRREQLDYYVDWVEMEKEQLRHIWEDLPNLSQELDPDTDVEFNIMYSYGMGSSPVCVIRGKQITWTNE